jgi:hypothetical protein
VDAAWWLRLRELEAELPGLLDVLWTAARAVDRVSYPIGAWLPAPRRLGIEGRGVWRGGFTLQGPSMICLRDAWGAERIDILVIPPEAVEGLAAAAIGPGEPSWSERARRAEARTGRPGTSVTRVACPASARVLHLS